MSSFFSYLISGISLGSIYALIALGYTMVYGIAKMLNFAHGDVIMIGGYISYFTFRGIGDFFKNPAILDKLSGALAKFEAFMLSTFAGIPVLNKLVLCVPYDTSAYIFAFKVLGAVIAAIVVCTVLGVAIEKIAYKPLRTATPLAVLITAIGVSYLLQNSALLSFGPASKTYDSVVPENLNASLGNINITGETIVTIVATIIIMIILTLFVNYTKSGKAMRAVSEDKGAAQLMGINVNRTISLTFAIGSALAAVAGILLCSTYPQIGPYTGAMPGIKAFTAAVFGGIGSIPGAMLGGIVLGIIENLSKAYISAQLSDAIVFAVLIVVLLVKPTGLLGKKISEKV